MADNKFDTPKLREYPIIPKLKKGVMSHSKPFIAKEPHQEPLGFPGELVDDWENVAIKKIAQSIILINSCLSFLILYKSSTFLSL